MTRTAFFVVLLALPAAAAVNAFFFGGELKRFLDRVPSLESTAHVEEMKRVVGRQMYAALLQIVLLATPILVFFAGIKVGVLVAADVLVVIVPSAVILLIAGSYRQTEARVKELPAADEVLQAERDAIVRTWLTKPFPDW